MRDGLLQLLGTANCKFHKPEINMQYVQYQNCKCSKFNNSNLTHKNWISSPVITMLTKAQAACSYVHVPHTFPPGTQPPSATSTYLILVCPPRSQTWNFRFLYVTVSTLKPIAVQREIHMGTVSAGDTTSLPDYFHCLICMYSGIFLLSTSSIYLLSLCKVREKWGEKFCWIFFVQNKYYKIIGRMRITEYV